MVYDRRYFELTHKNIGFSDNKDKNKYFIYIEKLNNKGVTFKELIKIGGLLVSAFFIFIIHNLKKFSDIIFCTEFLGKTYKDRAYFIVVASLTLMIILVRFVL